MTRVRIADYIMMGLLVTVALVGNVMVWWQERTNG